MPLTSNVTLSLQSHLRLGESAQSKPKQAIIVRISPETLEALEDFPNQPQMEFDFGENPGIYIGDTFFPVRPVKEDMPHELYLRAAPAEKLMAPLKLFANVTGKLIVERQLGEKVQDRVRDRTIAAETERKERKIQMLDAPPPDVGRSAVKKRREPPTIFRKVPHPSTQSRSIVAPTSTPFTQPQRVASPLPPPRDSHDTIRSRLIHCIALNSIRNPEDVIRRVAGPDASTASRREVLTILAEVAEKGISKNTTDKSSGCYQLKPRAWTEVRPYDYERLDKSDRRILAVCARHAFKEMGISEADPIWDHHRYRELCGGEANATQSTSAGAGRVIGSGRSTPVNSTVKAEPKRPLMSKDVKQKKAKAETSRRKANDIITAKDEGVRVPPKVEATPRGKEKEMDDSLPRPPARRLPGSGFKVKTGNSATPPATEMPATIQPTSAPRKGPVDARSSKRELPAPSGSAKPAPPIPPPSNQDRKPSNTSTGSSVRVLKRPKETPSEPATRERNGTHDREVAKTKDRGHDTQDRDRDRDPDRLKDIKPDRQRPRDTGTLSPLPAPTTGVKRRKVREEYDDESPEQNAASSAKKRRRIEEATTGNSSVRERREPPPLKKSTIRDSTPLAPPRPRIKKESPPASPLPQRRARSPAPPARSSLNARSSAADRAPPASSSSSSNQSRRELSASANGTGRRRKSPIYTSSEDEDPDSRPSAPRKEEPRPPKPKKRRFRAIATLPEDSEGLRGYYKTCYISYISLYQQKVMQKMRLEQLLQRDGDASVTESDDGDLLDMDELTMLSNDFKAVTDELERIKVAFAKLGGNADNLPKE